MLHFVINKSVAKNTLLLPLYMTHFTLFKISNPKQFMDTCKICQIVNSCCMYFISESSLFCEYLNNN